MKLFLKLFGTDNRFSLKMSRKQKINEKQKDAHTHIH